MGTDGDQRIWCCLLTFFYARELKVFIYLLLRARDPSTPHQINVEEKERMDHGKWTWKEVGRVEFWSWTFEPHLSPYGPET